MPAANLATMRIAFPRSFASYSVGLGLSAYCGSHGNADARAKTSSLPLSMEARTQRGVDHEAIPANLTANSADLPNRLGPGRCKAALA